MCRVLAYVPTHQLLFISQPSDPGYGIKKVYKLNTKSLNIFPN